MVSADLQVWRRQGQAGCCESPVRRMQHRQVALQVAAVDLHRVSLLSQAFLECMKYWVILGACKAAVKGVLPEAQKLSGFCPESRGDRTPPGGMGGPIKPGPIPGRAGPPIMPGPMPIMPGPIPIMPGPIPMPIIIPASCSPDHSFKHSLQYVADRRISG